MLPVYLRFVVVPFCKCAMREMRQSSVQSMKTQVLKSVHIQGHLMIIMMVMTLLRCACGRGGGGGGGGGGLTSSLINLHTLSTILPGIRRLNGFRGSEDFDD